MRSTRPIYFVVLSLFMVIGSFWFAGSTVIGQDAPPPEAIPSATLAPSDIMTYTAFLPMLLIPSRNYLPFVAQPPFLDEPYPPDASTDKSLNVFLTWKVWSGAFRAPTTFTVYLEENNPSPQTIITDSLTIPAFDPETLAEDTQYYWKVVATDANGRQAESATWTFRTEARPNPPDLGAMVEVPAGAFLMGCDLSNPYENYCSYNVWHQDEPVRSIYLDAFEIDKYEVTNSEYRACMEAGACDAPWTMVLIDDPDLDLHPVTFISWWNAKDFCTWEGKRLPTEAEWEKAARGPIDTRRWPWGNEEPDCLRTNSTLYRAGRDCNLLPKGTVPVGRYPRGATPYGAYDMTGNVFEWVNDKYDSNYYNYAPNVNPQGPPTSRTYRTYGEPDAPLPYEERGYPIFTLRDGPWQGHAHYMRVTHRHFGHHGPVDYAIYADAPYFRNERTGFRCAR